ncbi:MAG: DUF3362 domain-containing protein, partial [Burkholderiaceae bacterium]|nr:DUF3362 domain-containing protein [Burkholderiaceae bacterium]
HDSNNWPLLREALKSMGRADLIGNGKHHLIPSYQPLATGAYTSPRRKNSTPLKARPGRILTQHTGLPPREGIKAKPASAAASGAANAGANKVANNAARSSGNTSSGSLGANAKAPAKGRGKPQPH